MAEKNRVLALTVSIKLHNVGQVTTFLAPLLSCKAKRLH